MGRGRRAWLPRKGSGKRVDGRTGKVLPGYYVEYYEYADGSRRHRTKHFDRHRDAIAYRDRRNAQQALGLLGEVQPISMQDAVPEFVTTLIARSPATIIDYGTVLHRVTKELDNIDVCDVGRVEIDRLIFWRMSIGSEATAAKYVRVLKRFFRWAMAAGYADCDPTTLATAAMPRKNIVREKPLIADSQFAKLVTACETEDQRLFVLLAATTGLDRRVIEGLTAANIDLEARQIVVERKKAHRLVGPFIHDSLLPPLRQRCDRTAAGRPLLLGVTGRNWWRRVTVVAGMPTLRIADLRSYAVTWLSGALDHVSVSKTLGHSTVEVTARHYQQVDPKAQQQVSQLPLPGSPPTSTH